MKGQQKQFSRYLQSEYNDYSLEPLEKNTFLDNVTASSKKKPPQKQDKLLQHIESIGDKPKKSHYYYQKSDPSCFLTRDQLSQDPFKDFTFEFYEDDYSRVKYLELSEKMEDSLLFEAKTTYDATFKTYPMNILSCLPQEPIFLLKMTLYHTQLHHLDSSHKDSETGILASFVVFARINVSTHEKLIETKFLGTNWIYTKTKQGENQLSLRVYNTDGYLKMGTDFYQTRYSRTVGIISSAMIEIDIQNFKNIDGTSNYFKVNWKNETFNAKNNKICEGVHYTTHAFRTSDDLIILIDAGNATIVACKAYSIATLNCKIGRIKSIHQIESSLFLEGANGKEYQVTLKDFPEMKITQIDFSEDIKNIIQKLNESDARKKKVIEHFSNPKKLYYSTNDQLTYRYPRSIKGSESKPNINVNTELEPKETFIIREKKKEKSLFEKISQMEKGSKNCKNGEEALEVKKEMLKQIRKDISTKMREISKFDEEYKIEQNHIETEEKREPEKVSKQILDMYAKIKAEKKSLYREKDKKKKKTKQNYE